MAPSVRGRKFSWVMFTPASLASAQRPVSFSMCSGYRAPKILDAALSSSRRSSAVSLIIGDPKRSMFRINRDIRFSTDKSPYKTHAACWFRHRDASHQVGGDAEEGSAGLYFHLQPGKSFVGAGIWMPPRPALNKLRDAIAEDVRPFARIIERPAAKRRFGGLDDEAMLKRMPRGFAEDHRAAKWLRYQSFTIGRELSDKQVLGARLPALLEDDFTLMLPLVRWLNRALGLSPATSR